MSNYSMTEINNLIAKCNETNKNVIVSTLKNIIKEDSKLNIKLVKMEKINNIFFKKMKSDSCDTKFCSICQENIKSKEHKIKLDVCGHYFHKKCLNKYLKNCLTKFSCPNCKNNFNQEIKNIVNKIDEKDVKSNISI